MCTLVSLLKYKLYLNRIPVLSAICSVLDRSFSSTTFTFVPTLPPAQCPTTNEGSSSQTDWTNWRGPCQVKIRLRVKIRPHTSNLACVCACVRASVHARVRARAQPREVQQCHPLPSNPADFIPDLTSKAPLLQDELPAPHHHPVTWAVSCPDTTVSGALTYTLSSWDKCIVDGMEIPLAINNTVMM